jgi:hypothetical protein
MGFPYSPAQLSHVLGATFTRAMVLMPRNNLHLQIYLAVRASHEARLGIKIFTHTYRCDVDPTQLSQLEKT